MKNYKFYLVFFLFLAGCDLFAQTNQSPNWGWPVETNQNVYHRGKIVGSPGEYRSPYATGPGAPAFNPFPGYTTFTIAAGEPPRYHGGADITSPDGDDGCFNHYTNVYCFNGGGTIHYVDRSDDFNDRVLVGNTIYWHTVMDPTWMNNQSSISVNDVIGTMANVASEHVHVMPSFFNQQNYLISLPEYVDNSSVTLNQNSVHFYLNGAEQDSNPTDLANEENSYFNYTGQIEGMDYRLLYDVIDMEIDPDDTRTQPSGQNPGNSGTGCLDGDMAPNKVGYQIIGVDNNYSYPQQTTIDFTNSPSYESAKYTLRNQSDPGIDYAVYLLSNSTTLPYDRYWNTKHKKGVPQSYPEPGTTQYENQIAQSSMNSEYPDGRYKIRYYAYDADLGSNETNLAEYEYKIVLDNFKPHVTEVKVFVNSDLIKTYKWVIKDDKLFREETTGSSSWFYWNNPTVHIEVKTSEPINDYNLLLKKTGNNPPIQPTASGYFSNRHFWVDYATSGVGIFKPEIEYEIYVSGQDLFGNKLVRLSANPTPSIPHRMVNGWSHTTLEDNDLYKFKLKGECVLPGGGLTEEGEEASFTVLTGDCECEPVAGLTATPAPGGNTFNFDGSSSTGEQPLSYSWDFGDGASGTGIMPAHNYAEEGDYLVVLTIQDPCETIDTAHLWIHVNDGMDPELSVQITGPVSALINQEVTFNAIVSGGTPPYTYTWGAYDGQPHFVPNDPLPNVGINEDEQIIWFGESTNPNLGATVHVTVKDGTGQERLATFRIDIDEAQLELDFSHFPKNPSGLTPSDPIPSGQYLDWAADISPWSDVEPPINVYWDFDDGTPVENIPYGSFGHPLTLPAGMNGKVFHVHVRMTDAANRSVEKTKDYYVGNITPPPAVYKILPENTVNLYWGGPLQQIQFTNTSGNMCYDDPPISNRIKWTVYWGDCNYGVLENVGSNNPLMTINNPGFIQSTDPHGIRPWGCLTVYASDNSVSGLCGSASNACTVFMEPDPLVVDNIQVNSSSSCKYTLSANIVNGAWMFENFTTQWSAIKIYKEYKWAAFDIDNPDEEIDIFLDSKVRNPEIDLTHPYFEKFKGGQLVQFLVRLKVVDFLGQSITAGNVITFDPFRLTIKDEYSRCPDVWSYFENTPLATGGTGMYNFTWSVAQPAGSGLSFASNDAHDQLPYFKAPANGSKTYNLSVFMQNSSGANTCQLTKEVVVSSSALSLSMPNNVGACIPIGFTTLGPSDPTALGGSGNYGFEWSTSTMGGLAHLSDIFSPNPVVQNVPLNQTIVYTLTVSDLQGGCTTTAQVYVSGYKNFLSVEFDPLLAPICYGEPFTLQAYGQPSVNFPEYTWETNNPHVDLPPAGTGNSSLILDNKVNSYPGIYNYKVRYTDRSTGCFAESEIELNVLPKWTHIGYDPKVKTAVLGTVQNLWDGGNTNRITSGPDLSNIYVTWPNGSPTTVTTYGSSALPTNGTFTPTVDAPYLVMAVHDMEGCSKEFKSIRYILLGATPTLQVKPEPNRVVCTGEELCFDIEFDVHFVGGAHLPPTLPFQYKLSWPFTNMPSFSGTVTLTLETASGLYKGTICKTDMPSPSPDGTVGKFFVNSTKSVSDLFGYASETYDFYVKAHQTKSSYTGCNLTYTGTISYSWIKLGVGCPNPTIPANVNNIQIEAGDYILIKPEGTFTITAGANGVHYYINPCIDEQLQSPPPESVQAPDTENGVVDKKTAEERHENRLKSVTDLAMTIRPNPFSGEVKVTYSVNNPLGTAVTIRLLDFTGKVHAVLLDNQWHESGEYEVSMNDPNLAPGMYLFELITSDQDKLVQRVVKM